MTQDPYGQPLGTGRVVRGEVVPDDEGNVTPPTTPMTQFQKVASALRGDRTDPAIPVYGPAGQGTVTTSPDARTDADQDAQDDADQDATRPEEVVAVRSPDAGTRGYWDETDERGAEQGAAAGSPDEPAADAGADVATQDPTTTQPDLFGSAARPAAGTPDVATADTATADTATAGAAGAVGAAEASEAGAAAEPEVAGKHAGAAVQEGLRPGGSDRGPGDLGDLTYGSLLPDAAEFKARWQQVQFRFVDDPQGSVTEAADVIAQVTDKLEAAIAERQRALRGRWTEGTSTDTESLRETLLMYRAFLDQLTGPKDG
jgi:hypothetical protein